ARNHKDPSLTHTLFSCQGPTLRLPQPDPPLSQAAFFIIAPCCLTVKWVFLPAGARRHPVAASRWDSPAAPHIYHGPPFRIKGGRPRYAWPLGRMCGKRITSRMEGESVRSITSRSMPIPSPPAGG